MSPIFSPIAPRAEFSTLNPAVAVDSRNAGPNQWPGLAYPSVRPINRCVNLPQAAERRTLSGASEVLWHGWHGL